MPADTPVADAAAAQTDGIRAPRGTRRRTRAANARFQAAPARPEPERPEARPDGPRLTRSRRRTDNRFHIDPRIIPPGMSWEWKAEKVTGQEQQDYMAELRENHWVAVDPDKHVNLITRKDGMILMQRPLYLTKEARLEDLQIAQERVMGVQNMVSDTPSGTMTRNHPSARANQRVSRAFDIAIPGDGAKPVDGEPT